MGLLSSLGAGLKAFATPDNLALIGAGLKDLANPDENNLMRVSQLVRQRQAEKGLLSALGGLGGAGATTPPIMPPNPATGGPAYRGMGPGEDGEALTSPKTPAAPVPHAPTLSEAMPALLKAKAAGADIGDYVSLISSMQPKYGISGDVPYTLTSDGKVTWGEQRPMTQREKIEQDRLDRLDQYRQTQEDYRDRQLQALIDYRNGQLGLGRGRLKVSQDREGRIASGKGKKQAGGGYGGGVGAAPGGWR